MSLLKEITKGDVQADLKVSDGSDAGKNDTTSDSDIRFSLMRNMINTDKDVSGADVSDYLERAHELNDEVDTVGFAIETNDDDVIKIYVNAKQAVEFEQEMSKLLGLNDDTEVAINTLAQKFDIVDIVWPKDSAEEEKKETTPATSENEPDNEVVDQPSELPAPPETNEELVEGVSEEIETHIADMIAKGNKGRWFIHAVATGGHRGRRDWQLKKDGEIQYFDDEAAAILEANRLSAEKNVAGAKAHFIFTPKLVEVKEDIHMDQVNGVSDSLGTQFLKRLSEAAENDGVRDGLNVKLDTGQRGLVSRLTRSLEKEIVVLFAMVGVPGRYLNVDGIEDSIREAADMLRRQSSVRKAFLEFYNALGASKGFTVKDNLDEAKAKRGGYFQKMLEGVLIKLGLPGALVVAGGPGAVNTFLFRVSKEIDADHGLERALRQLALRLDVKVADEVESVQESTGAKFLKQVLEDINTEHDEFLQKVLTLVQALGVPEANLQYQQSNLLKALREKKLTLGNRGMLEQRVDALIMLLQKSTRGEQPQEQVVEESLLTEAFSPLEAVTHADLKNHKVVEPHAGPAMMASYENSVTHEETTLVLGVDPEAEDDAKSLCVSIVGPWDGTMHHKYFADTKEGYKAAVDYANMLRTANLKSGGKPKGWKN